MEVGRKASPRGQIFLGHAVALCNPPSRQLATCKSCMCNSGWTCNHFPPPKDSSRAAAAAHTYNNAQAGEPNRFRKDCRAGAKWIISQRLHRYTRDIWHESCLGGGGGCRDSKQRRTRDLARDRPVRFDAPARLSRGPERPDSMIREDMQALPQIVKPTFGVEPVLPEAAELWNQTPEAHRAVAGTSWPGAWPTTPKRRILLSI